MQRLEPVGSRLKMGSSANCASPLADGSGSSASKLNGCCQSVSGTVQVGSAILQAMAGQDPAAYTRPGTCCDAGLLE